MAEQDYNLGDIIDIDYEIASNLDYKSLVRLMTTNRRFHSYRNQESFKLLLKEKYDELFKLFRQKLYSLLYRYLSEDNMRRNAISVIDVSGKRYITLYHHEISNKVIFIELRELRNLDEEPDEEDVRREIRHISDDEAVNYLIDNRLIIELRGNNEIITPDLPGSSPSNDNGIFFGSLPTDPDTFYIDIDKYFKEMMRVY